MGGGVGLKMKTIFFYGIDFSWTSKPWVDEGEGRGKRFQREISPSFSKERRLSSHG
jgi:hypothetical protein